MAPVRAQSICRVLFFVYGTMPLGTMHGWQETSLHLSTDPNVLQERPQYLRFTC